MGFRRELLEHVVDAYDRRGEPVTVADAADAADADRERVATCLATFAECHLVVEVRHRTYRPTVTARELLALEVDGCVVDPGEGSAGEH